MLKVLGRRSSINVPKVLWTWAAIGDPARLQAMATPGGLDEPVVRIQTLGVAHP
jgi:hypothetical protein